MTTTKPSTDARQLFATPADNDLAAELAKLRAENDALKRDKTKTQAQGLTLKVSQKGAVSVYGLGRWPITLYREQMTRLLDAKEDILAYIEANSGALKTKGDEPRPTV